MSSSRDISRDIRRLASLYNDVTTVQLQALCFNVCASNDPRHDIKMEIWAQQGQKPTSTTSIFGDQVPERLSRTFISINKCIAVIVYNTGCLAHCWEHLNIDVKELELDKPKRVNEVLVYHHMPGDKL
ncbi:hypothetical protein E8E11_005261 [Didymella keratinophila]|nr:hypothetical protein E8E11_005261 [Didymella keratinophila]